MEGKASQAHVCWEERLKEMERNLSLKQVSFAYLKVFISSAANKFLFSTLFQCSSDALEKIFPVAVGVNEKIVFSEIRFALTLVAITRAFRFCC